jgi:hypothetical protein
MRFLLDQLVLVNLEYLQTKMDREKFDELGGLLNESRVKQKKYYHCGLAGVIAGTTGISLGAHLENEYLMYAGLAVMALSAFGYAAFSHSDSEKINQKAVQRINETSPDRYTD